MSIALFISLSSSQWNLISSGLRRTFYQVRFPPDAKLQAFVDNNGFLLQQDRTLCRQKLDRLLRGSPIYDLVPF